MNLPSRCYEKCLRLYPVLLFALTIFVSGCGSDTEPNNFVVTPLTNQGEHRYFEEVSSLPENCSPDPIINCTADLYLCADGTAILSVTDILNGGTYTEFPDRIESSWGLGDVPESIIFTKQSSSQIIDDKFGITWQLTADDFIDSICG